MQSKKMKALLFVSVLAASSLAVSHFATAKTLATVNGVKIESSEVDALFDRLPANSVQGKEAEIRQNILSSLIEKELMLQAAKDEKIMDSKEFKEAKKNQEETLAYNMLVQKHLNEKLTNELVQQKYEEIKGNFAREAVSASHILVADEKDAKKLIKQLAKGEDFAKLAKENSIDTSNAEKGGSLGWFGRNEMVKEFEEAAFALDKGAFSKEPVKTQFGYHVIYVDDKNDQMVPPFNNMAPAIRQELAKELMRNYVQELTNNAKIEIK